MKEALDSHIDLSQYVRNCGMAARTASRIVAQASTRQKNEALLAMAQAIAAGQSRILEQNHLDVAAGKQQGLADALLDRLELTPDRVGSMVHGFAPRTVDSKAPNSKPSQAQTLLRSGPTTAATSRA